VIKELLDKLPKWKTWATSLVALCAALYAMYAWGADTIDRAIVTEGELGLVMKQLRINKNQDKLMELNRDVIAERYANDAEKEFIISEIKDIQKELKCDVENICDASQKKETP
jgi:hypothetical protein